MSHETRAVVTATTPIPADDLRRKLAVAGPKEDGRLKHVSVAGGVYTILISGDDTGGLYCLIEMQVPPGGGPPPHRHDFEEMFFVLEGQIEATFRGSKTLVGTGETINIPANAPHSFQNVSKQPARLLCTCVPAGQDKFFLEVGDPVANRMSAPPQLDEAARVQRMARAKALAAKYRTELLTSPDPD